MASKGIIEKPHDLSAHFQFLSDHQVYCRLISISGKIIAKGTVIFDTDSGLLQFSPAPLDWFDHERLTIKYGYDSKTYNFKTRPAGVEKGALALETPSSVSFLDRRKKFRVTPSRQDPVVVRMLLPEKPEIRIEAEDISGDGFSVVLSRHIPISGAGMTFPVTIRLPNEKKITARATVKWRNFFMDAMWIGCHLSHIEEKDQNKIVSYCLREQLKKTNVSKETRLFDPKKTSVFIIDAASSADTYAYIKGLFSFEIVNTVKSIARLRQDCPELVVLNTDHAGSNLILQTLVRDRLLKSLPLIIIGKHRKLGDRPGPVIKVNSPFTKSFFIKTLMETIKKIQRSRSISRSYYRCFAGERKKITIVDPKIVLDRSAFNILVELGYSLRWIQKEHGVMERTSEIKPDLLLIANDTGEMDAATLCRLFNLNTHLKFTPKIRLIQAGTFSKPTGLKTGKIVFLEKPFDADQLVQAVYIALYGEDQPEADEASSLTCSPFA
jgi:CheY-like chemotaxis protein